MLAKNDAPSLVVIAFIVIAWKTCSPCLKWGEHLRRSFAAAMAAGLAILPYALYRLVTSYQTNDLHEQIQGVLFVGGGLFVADPMRVWNWMGWMGLGALVAVVPLWRYRRTIPGVGFGIASMLTVLFIVMNPLLLPPVFEVLTYLVLRLGRVVSHYMIAALLITSAFGVPALSRAARPRWWRLATVLAMVGAILGAGRMVTNRHVLFASSAAEKRVSHERWAGFVIAATDGLPEGSVIASER